MDIVYTDDQSFERTMDRIQHRGGVTDPEIIERVSAIVRDVAERGDEALFEYTEQFDGCTLDETSVEVPPGEMDRALAEIDGADRDVLELAARRIEVFHRNQCVDSWSTADEDGIELGQLIRPLERVGIYAPGGRAAYPSTVLMAAIPARVAGVNEIILVTPIRDGGISPLIRAAARIGGVDRIFTVGGAQAIAALAYGTASIPAVDKIVGPGNVYVATAKQMVYGRVGIDMIAGPSEIVIIADGSVKAAVVAADLLSQAEHDPLASAVLLTPVKECALAVAAEVDAQLTDLNRREIAARSIEDYGAIIVTKDIDEALAIANRFAPEHLELMVERPRELLGRVGQAGAIFLGDNAPEVLGDYMAGPNHILPTGGTARFSSPLGVYDFVKRTSTIAFSAAALHRYGASTRRFAELEGLDGHGRSITVRQR